jgi:hypothetical protein
MTGGLPALRQAHSPDPLPAPCAAGRQAGQQHRATGIPTAGRAQTSPGADMQAAAARKFGQPLMIDDRPWPLSNDSGREVLHGAAGPRSPGEGRPGW